MLKIDTMKYLTIIFNLIFIICNTSSCKYIPEKDLNIPSDFVESIIPESGSKEWYELNHSRYEFEVKMINNKLKVNEYKWNINSEVSKLKISNGNLVGIYQGEWGGVLLFVPNDTTQDTITIKKGTIKFIFSYRNGIYFIEGCAHMGTSIGALYKIDTIDNKFLYSKILDFEDAPEAYTIYKDKIFIASHESFYVVQDFKKKLVFSKTFWCSLYPNSIAVIDESNVYIGIRSGIIKLDLSTNDNIRFFKYYKQ